VRVVYDPTIISYRKLVELYWTQVNPTDDSGQFNDRGFVYSTAIYYSNEQEKSVAQASKTELEMSGRFDSEIVTPIVLATPFYDAEDYHQNYYKENVIRYNLYTVGSGRK
jgi:peptide methionine sulfoxide reductase msrA/msrB